MSPEAVCHVRATAQKTLVRVAAKNKDSGHVFVVFQSPSMAQYCSNASTQEQKTEEMSEMPRDSSRDEKPDCDAQLNSTFNTPRWVFSLSIALEHSARCPFLALSASPGHSRTRLQLEDSVSAAAVSTAVRASPPGCTEFHPLIAKSYRTDMNSVVMGSARSDGDACNHPRTIPVPQWNSAAAIPSSNYISAPELPIQRLWTVMAIILQR